jgi:hypothetical protein
VAGKTDFVVEQLAAALPERGYVVELGMGQSNFRCDLAVRAADSCYQLGILVDTAGNYTNAGLLDRYQPSILHAFGWRCVVVLTKDWYYTPDDVLARIDKISQGQGIDEPEESAPDEKLNRLRQPRRSSRILRKPRMPWRLYLRRLELRRAVHPYLRRTGRNPPF